MIREASGREGGAIEEDREPERPARRENVRPQRDDHGGHQRDDRERGLLLPGGNALLALFLVIVWSGLRLL